MRMPTNWSRTCKQTRKQGSQASNHVRSTKGIRPKDQPDPLGGLDLSDSEDDTNNQIIDECENMKWDGGFYRETKGSHGREVTNEKEVP